MALPFGAIGVLLLVLSGPAATTARRHLGGWAFLAVASVFLVSPAFDTLAAHVREGRVEMVEGAIGKRRCNRQLHGKHPLLPEDWRPAASDLPVGLGAGARCRLCARVLSAPHAAAGQSRAPAESTAASQPRRGARHGRPYRARVRHGRFWRSRGALASAAGLIDAAKKTIGARSDAPGGLVAGGLARDALVGKWTHSLATVTFPEDGTATVTTIMGATVAGHWSVDGRGRLLTDVSRTMEPTDAVLEGGLLTIQVEGRRLTFTRADRY